MFSTLDERDRSREMTGRPGRYEGLSAFEVFLCEHVDDLQDEVLLTLDDFGYFAALVGRRVVYVDDYGFWGVHVYASADEARANTPGARPEDDEHDWATVRADEDARRRECDATRAMIEDCERDGLL